MRVGTTWLINDFFLKPLPTSSAGRGCHQLGCWVGISNKKEVGERDIPLLSWHIIICGGCRLVIKKKKEEGWDIPSSSCVVICG